MASPFTVTTAASNIVLSQRQGAATFTVSNTSQTFVRGRARLVSDTPLVEAWLTLSGESERDFAVAATEQYQANVSVPPTAPGGQYTFRLDMVNVENPDEDYVQGPAVTFEAPQPEEPKKWWIVAAIVGGLAVIGVILFILLREKPTIQVPNVAGETVAGATVALQELGLEVVGSREQASTTVPAGQVIGTEPAAGADTPEGSDVILIVSSGASTAQVPDVSGQTETEASASLVAAGFSVGGSRQEASDTVPAGSVIGTEPSDGAEVAQGSGVALVISSGPGTVAVPDVAGQTEAQAAAVLVAAGFSVSGSRQEASNAVPAGGVIGSEPSSGTMAAEGAAVTLIVSSGAGTIVIPDVDDRLEADARQLLEQACQPQPCLVVSTVEEESSDTAQGRVIRTEPAAGELVAPGSSVNLVVSAGQIVDKVYAGFLGESPGLAEIDHATHTVEATVNFGEPGARFVSASAQRQEIYVSFDHGIAVEICDAATLTIKATIPNEGGYFYGDSVVSPDGQMVYLASRLSMEPELHNRILVIDPAARAVSQVLDLVPYTLGVLGGFAVSPDGKTLYTMDRSTAQLIIVDVASMSVSQRIDPPAPSPRLGKAITLSPLVVEVAPLLTKTKATPRLPFLPKTTPGVFKPLGTPGPTAVPVPTSQILGIARDGSALYVQRGDRVRKLSVANWQTIWSVEVTGRVNNVAVGDNVVYIPDHDANRVIRVEDSSGDVMTRWEVQEPLSVALVPDGSYIYISAVSIDRIFVYETASLAQRAQISLPAGSGPTDLVALSVRISP